ncbi:glycosyltransferase family 39 protein [Roridomyces roridus]|uniref:Dolichyl-phosphate-mannose--protein mannosyltransferase n=1 Tax=Roridomyces roridus TaxID=1738132 RepID=A0AAD7BE09_9AGAR|nr:glycosyltransferase family 39 protein [Roridomyces roridus]
MAVRARRPASPPPGASHAPPPHSSQRFPHARQDHLDADVRRAAASKGLAPGRSKPYPLGGMHIDSGEWKLLAGILLVAFAVRLFRLSKPSSVVFDEVHFGKFASKYIKTQYFVDVHPPLAKLLITLAAFVFGYDGNFEFKDIGKPYDAVPYVAMRLVPALLGIATIPLSYLTLRGLDCRATTALLASLFITFENGLVTQSRYILLDSPLIFFTALTTFFWVGFCNEDKHEPFTESWWGWLFMSGLSLGAVVSSKWLWMLLGDLRVSPRLWIRHFVARALCLILVPVLFYMGMFQIHFMILGSSGDGDGFMSSEFQHTLGGRGMADTFADVLVGSQITLRHINTQGGYLHSHAHSYPGGSKQQQITLYPHRDQNNDWTIYNATWIEQNSNGITHITDRMRVKLKHISTEKHLHSHDVRPPVSDVDFQNEVSAYGMAGFDGDANDDWWLEIVHGDKSDPESSKRLRTLRTQFRLRHALTGCYLFSHKIKLPEWGFEQQEVTCNKNAVMANSLWKVETAMHPNLPANAPKVNYRLPGFLAKFWELQQVMWTTNAGLTDRHTFDSRPDAWPRLRRGINFWVKDHTQVYLVGNAMVWWLSSLAVFSYIAVRGILILRAKRGFRDFESTKVVKYDGICGFLFLGWFLHYFPFYLMARQLFLHHYFPALYFAILLFAGVFDFVTSTLRPRVRLQIAAVLIILAIWNFVHFSPLAYGTQWTRSKCMSSKWLKTWDFSCNEFPESYSEYAGVHAPTTHSVPSIATAQGAPEGEPEAETTTASVIKVKPEPGHDIFGGNEREENTPGVVDEDQIISDAMQTTAMAESGSVSGDSAEVEASASDSVSAVDEKKEDSSSAALSSESAASAEGESSEASSSSSSSSAAAVVEEPAKAPKPAGPLGEAEVEADKAAEELFPNAFA